MSKEVSRIFVYDEEVISYDFNGSKIPKLSHICFISYKVFSERAKEMGFDLSKARVPTKLRVY